MTDPCSVWSYHEIVKAGYLGKVQAAVLAVISENEGYEITLDEVIARSRTLLGEKTRDHSVQPRLAELVNMGLLEKGERVENQETGKTVNTWKWTGRKIPKVKVSKLCRCEKCDGRGSYMRDVWEDQSGQKELFPKSEEKHNFYEN